METLIQKLVKLEVDSTSDPNTLFRGNSLASKVIDEFMKLAGRSYLQRTLQGCVDEVSLLGFTLLEINIPCQIFEVRRQCEIDPSRLIERESDQRDVNMVGC